MKKILCMLMALLMLSAGFTAMADESAWEFDGTDFKLTEYKGEGGAVVIPETISDCTVDIFGLNVLNNNDTVTSLTLPTTLRQIENGAISFCTALTELVIPEGVQIIGDNCVVGNPLLTELVIPASVCYIGDNSFGSNESLKKVTFLGECPVFAGAALDWIADDAEIYVPDDLYDVYAEALYEAECTSTVLPSGANAVVIERTTDASEFEFDASTGTITLYNGYSAYVEIPETIDGAAVKTIGEYAFASHGYLCYLVLPEGLETIGDSAFEWCNTLLYVDFPSTLKTVGNRAFYAGYKGYMLDMPAVETIGDEAFAQCIRIFDPVYLPEGLKTIGKSAFEACGWMSEVYIPSTVETIGEKAFADSSVNYVVFEGLNLPVLADNAFENCEYLADIDLHSDATKQDMLSLQAAVDAMGLECRVWRTQNPDVEYIEDGLDVYENGVMVAYTGTQTHLRPWDTYEEYDVTALGEGVFKGSQTIEYFAVPYNDVFTTIGAEAFAESSLRVVDLFDSVTTIGDGAFRDCVNLESITLPDSVTSIGSSALRGCTAIKELVIPDSVTSIGSEALRGCTAMEELVIPASVTEIGAAALADCTALRKLTVLCDASILPDDLLAGCNAEMEVYAAETATDDQLKYLSAVAGRAWYNPVTRVGESPVEVPVMLYEPLPIADFWYDTEFARIDNYDGYELNLILPREAEGVQLTMVGGSLMQRASYGDNFEAELPVVSVVIPETYTEIVPFAFANCASLETVICYAPIEKLPEYVFSNCTSLRTVIFAGGVHSIDPYVFHNCPKLETVYFGPYVETVSDFAFLNEEGDTVWSMDKCITDPALMPDIDMLIEAVKVDPADLPAPVPAATPAPAVPVGEEGKPFFGVWNGTEMNIGGDMVKLSDWEMTMTMVLLEDGRVIMSDEEITDLNGLEEIQVPVWRVENGIALTEDGTITALEDGRLLFDEDGFLVYFERSEREAEILAMFADFPVQTAPAGVPDAVSTTAATAAPTTAPTTAPAKPEGSVQTDSAQRTEIKFVCRNADMNGFLMDASMLGGEYSLIFHDNGSTDFVVAGSPLPTIPWTKLDNGNFQIDYFGTKMEVVWTESGFDMNYFDTMLMHFVPQN